MMWVIEGRKPIWVSRTYVRTEGNPSIAWRIISGTVSSEEGWQEMIESRAPFIFKSDGELSRA
jgi:hypothetical protein